MTDFYVAAPASAGWQGAEPTKLSRTPRTRRYAMTPPTFFAVEYAINPWLDVTTTVDVHVAQAQWEGLYQTYLRLGHHVDLVEPVHGLPDMVYAANGGLIAHDIAIVARFRFAERAGESVAVPTWFYGHEPPNGSSPRSKCPGCCGCSSITGSRKNTARSDRAAPARTRSTGGCRPGITARASRRTARCATLSAALR